MVGLRHIDGAEISHSLLSTLGCAGDRELTRFICTAGYVRHPALSVEGTTQMITRSFVAAAAMFALLHGSHAFAERSDLDKKLDRSGSAVGQPAPPRGGLLGRLDGDRLPLGSGGSIGYGPGGEPQARVPNDGGGQGFTPGINLRMNFGGGGSRKNRRVQQQRR